MLFKYDDHEGAETARTSFGTLLGELATIAAKRGPAHRG